MEMDKFTFALGCIGCISIVEAAAIIYNRDGAILAALTAIIGGIAGAVLGVTIVKKE
jgi:hypothetical protein